MTARYEIRHACTSLLPEVLRKCLTDVFVETGTNLGHAAQLALDVGFSRVLTIERDARLARAARKRFAGRQVRVVHGSSPQSLLRIVSKMKVRATVYLDAHGPENSTPLLDEIAALCRGLRRDHVILIDDVRMFGSTAWGGVTEQDAFEALLRINDKYVFSYEDTNNGSRDLLVAKTI